MTVPFFSMAGAIERSWDTLDPLLDEALAGGPVVNGPLVRRLERQIAEYTGARETVAVASGSDALILMLEAAGIGAGDEVIVPVYTFFATASSVVHTGAKPVFADVDPDTYAIDPGACEGRLGERTAALMPVHPFTQMADMEALASIAEREGIELLEDSAQGIGMRDGGRHAGTIGRAGILSFFPTKTLGALGDAGMILTGDPELAERCRSLRNHGQRPGARPYVWQALGRNSRMDDIQAAVLLARLSRLPAEIAWRTELARMYDERLAPLAELVRTPRPATRPGGSRVYYVYLIEAHARDELVEHLARRGIETETYYPRPLHLQPCFASLGYARGDFPVAEAAATRAVALPLYPDMTEAAVDEVCEAITAFYDGSPRGPAAATLTRSER